MADLGSIAVSVQLGKALPDVGPRCLLRVLTLGHVPFYLGGKETTEGNPSQPSLRLETRGKFRFRWVVESGSRTISIDVKQAANGSPRPSLVILANSDIGVSQASGSAASGAGWVTIGPVSITPSGNGAVWVELRANHDAMYAPCYWDNLAIT